MISNDINTKISENKNEHANNTTNDENASKNAFENEFLSKLSENIISLHAKFDSYAARNEHRIPDDNISNIMKKIDDLTNNINTKPLPRNAFINSSKVKHHKGKTQR